MTALGLADLEPVRLELREHTTRLADATRDTFREVDVVGVEVDVVRDQERPGTDGDRPRRGMHPAGAEVGLASVLLDLEFEALVLATTDVGEALAVSAQRRPRVEVDGQFEAHRDPLA